ncbi:MAG: hypothetical protein JKX97_01635 [Candidatus Lindowbacteria bacterium]|nr:hypothetical protein [Candidatus Lindowbacteria bacterium]
MNTLSALVDQVNQSPATALARREVRQSTNGTDGPSDKSNLSRSKLIGTAINAMWKGSFKRALRYLGAAHRKAKKQDLRDVESTFYKFVIRYKTKEYDKALLSCVDCINHAAEMQKRALAVEHKLPFEALANDLFKFALKTRSARGDGFFRFVRYFWAPRKAEIFPGRPALGLVDSIITTLQLLHDKPQINLDLIDIEIEQFTRFLIHQFESLGLDNEGAATLTDRTRSPGKLFSKNIVGEQLYLKMDKMEFYKSLYGRNISVLNEDEIEALTLACSHAAKMWELGMISEIIKESSEKHRCSILTALAESPLLSDSTICSEGSRVIPLYEEVLDFVWSRRALSEGLGRRAVMTIQPQF